jgi:hypothetical protein
LGVQITIFDNRGCTQHKNKEYGGPKAGTADDEMVVKVSNEKILYPTNDVVEEVGLFLSCGLFPSRPHLTGYSSGHDLLSRVH